MKRIRIQVILLVGWLVVIYSLERLLEPIKISNFTYLLVLAMVIVTLVSPRVVRIPLWGLLALPVPFLLAFKAWSGALAGGTAVLLTLAEACLISLTTLLVHLVSLSIDDFESAVARITIGQRDRIPETATMGQGYLYREVRRARNHQRPLSIMAVAVDEKSIQVALDRMVQEAQLAMMKQYTLSGVSKTLCEKLEDCDIILQSNNHFLVVLPETIPEDMPRLIERLRQEAMDKMGVTLKIGTSSLPQDGYTLDGLVDKATKGMEADRQEQMLVDLERLSLEHHLP